MSHIIASEVINLLTKKQFGGNIAIKVDIRKAFDTLDWNFLLAVLRQFGFNDLLLDFIYFAINTPLYFGEWQSRGLLLLY